MEEGTKILDHLSNLNSIIFELEAIEVKIDDEDKALRLILSLLPSYEHMKPILMYGKDPLNFAEATSKLLLEKRRLKSEGRTSRFDTDEPDEDRSKWSCTLFELIYDADLQVYRIRHVKLGYFLIPHTGPIAADYTIYAGTATPDPNNWDVFAAIDFQSLLVLPKLVAFKGDNGQYLRAAMQEHHEYLEFSGTSIGDDKAAHEILMNDDGSVRVKSKFFGKFWRLSPRWIWADLTDASSDNPDTCFWPFKYSEDNTIALKNLGNSLFRKRLTVEGKTDCLNASASNMGSSETKLTIEELIHSREIEIVEFRTAEAKIYHETIDMKNYTNIENNGSEDVHEEFQFSFKDIATGTFSTTLSLKVGVKTTIETKVVPYIFENKIELSAEFAGSFTWGKTYTFEKEFKNLFKFTVPPKKKVKARLVATKGSCNVPFSYTQRDTLLDGRVVTTTIHDGMFYGVNC
ncbi:uncharacterized protein LOC111014651 [Momordica charantia]|uniref:Uncharacterized protein LOC111014651 n=1 Tax=Momordica charantia TaxID=3673 RepID=A0A6J1CTL7_MOMCH|nr:uncharacterized protein LOC111014651 [Momordica charantia]